MKKKHKILIVEDETIIAMELSHRLTRIGYDVVAAVTSGKEAIKETVELLPDLILMDIHINGSLDGIETARIINSAQDIPIIYLTAFSDDKTLERAKLTEPYGFLIKPFEERELETTIEVALYKRTVGLRQRENELWLDATLKNINDGIITTDIDGKINFTNNAAIEILSASREDVLGQTVKNVFRVLDYESKNELENPVLMLMGNSPEEIKNKEMILQRLDSSSIIIEATTSVIKNEYGAISGAVLVFRDISVKKNADELLRKSEERYRAVVEQSTDGIILFEIDTMKVIKSNLAYQKISCYSEEELLHLTAFDLMINNGNKNGDSFNKAVKFRNTSIGEKKARRKDGSFIDVEVTISLISYLDREVICVIVRDISEKKKIEKIIRESEQTYRTLFESMTQGIIYQDKEGNIISANPAAFRILGLSMDGMISQLSIDPKWRNIHKSNNEFKGEEHPSITALRTGQKVTDVHIKIFSPKEKVHKWILLDAIPEFREGDSEPYRIFTTFSDITEQKNLLDKLEKSQESLKEINATKDKFFSIVAHDLKAPFQGLLGFSNILAENTDDLTNEEVKRISTNIHKATKSLYQLIDHLLNWSRLQANRMECVLEKLLLHEVVIFAINIVSPNAMGKSVTIENKISEDVSVQTDERMLSSICENLLSNAIKFSQRGGIITISSKFVDDFAEVCVRDNGVGINKDDMDKLFKIEYSHTSKGTEGEAGTGLGLILCHEMVNKLGGKIWVESEIGKGSSFYFTLPKA
ncbi:MAG: hybrid sensor histidine kinase/response regulator [Melioribacteraceae bacterium]